MTKELKPGDHVTVYRLHFDARPLIEGKATIVASDTHEPHLYKVQFTNERQIRTRFVHAGIWQSDPGQMLHALVEHWRGSTSPEVYGDFSPPLIHHTTKHTPR